MDGISEAQLALDTGISRATLRRRLAGTSDWLTSELTAISAGLGVPLVELLADEVAA
jgi:transcriptional regulator with XRE-family HTH domain